MNAADQAVLVQDRHSAGCEQEFDAVREPAVESNETRRPAVGGGTLPCKSGSEPAASCAMIFSSNCR